MAARLRNHQYVVLLSGTFAFFLVLFLLLLQLNMRKYLDHDEQQFIAAGALASHSLIPYRDYPFTHTPYLAFIYGTIFKHTDYLLLSARGLSTLAEFAALGLVFYVTFNLFREWQHLLRFCIAVGAVMLLFTNPLFIYTSGRAWNHAVPELATLVAFVLQCYGVRQERGTKWVFMSGMLLGFATGTRITFASAIIPLGSLIFLSPDAAASRARLRLSLSFAAGVGLAMLPALLLLTLYPQRFIFDLIGYTHFDSVFLCQRWRTLCSSKVVTHVFLDPGNLVLGFLFVLSFLSLRATDVRAKMRGHSEVMTILLLVLFLLIGSFVKVPPRYPQYFYAPIPFLVLGSAYSIASLGKRDVRGKWLLRLLALAVFVSSVNGLPQYPLPQYRHVRHLLLSLDEWFPVEAHAIGTELRKTAGTGRVLTLAPIFPLEGGAKIYCEFAAGPFTWRIANLLPKAERSTLGLIAPDDLNQFLQAQAPVAVLVGFEKEVEVEAPLVAYAKAGGYKNFRLSNEADLWVSADYGAANRENESKTFCRLERKP